MTNEMIALYIHLDNLVWHILSQMMSDQPKTIYHLDLSTAKALQNLPAKYLLIILLE
jgi:hypothetical protein